MTDADLNVRYDTVSTYKIADSQSFTAGDPCYISSGKVAAYSSSGIISNAIGVANETKSMGVLATVGQQEYIGIVRKGDVAFTGLVEDSGGTYTSAIENNSVVSLYYDGTNFYVVADTTAPIGRVVDGTVAYNASADSTATVIVAMDLTFENITTAEIPWPLTVPTDSKIQFRGTGQYIQSAASDKLTIEAASTDADAINLTANTTVTGDLVVTGAFSHVETGGVFTSTVQLNDQAPLQFEGVAGDADGLVIDCDASGDSTISCTAGMVDFSTKDGVVRLADADVATDYLDIITGSGSDLVVLAGEPNGKFRFKDAGDANNSDVLDFTLTDAASANVINSAVALTISTTAGDLTLAPTGNDIIFGTSAGKINLGAADTKIYGGDTTADDLELHANSADTDNARITLNGAGNIDALIKDQDFVVKYDDSNYLKVECSSSGDVVLTAEGATDSFEIVTSDGSITLTSAADIVLAAAGNDVTMDAQLTITETGSDQLLVKYDGSNHFGVDVDSDGSTTLTTTGTNADFEIASGTAGDITLDATAAIILEPGTNVTYTMPAAGIITIDAGTTDTTAATVLTMDVDVNSANCKAINLDMDVGTALSAAEKIYGAYLDVDGNAGDDAGAYVYGAYITSANTSTGVTAGLVVAGTWDTAIDFTGAQSWTFGAAEAITIDAGTTDRTADLMTINMDVNSASVDAIYMDIDVGTALSAAEVVNGLNIDVDGDAGDNADSYLNGIYITSANTTGGVQSGINFAGTYDQAVMMTMAATGRAINIDADTTDRTASDLIYMDVGVDSASCNVINANIDVGTALSASEHVKGIYFDINGKAADANTSTITGVGLLMTGIATSAADLIGYTVQFDGTKNAGDATYGLFVDCDATLDNVGEVFNGVRIDTAGVTDTSSSELAALKLLLGASTEGINIDAGTTDHTAGNIITANIDVNSASVNFIYADIDVGTALSSAETVNGLSIDIDGDGADAGDSAMNGIYLTSANTTTGVNTGLNIAGTWDNMITLTVAAATTAINIDAGTTDHTGSTIVTANLDVNSASCTFINATIDVGTLLSAGETVKGVYLDINGLAAQEDTSAMIAYDTTMTGVSTGEEDFVAYKVTFDGTKDGGDTTYGLFVDANQTLNNASEVLNLIRLDTVGVTDTSSSELAAAKFVLGASTEAINIDAGTTDHTAGNIVTMDLDVNSASVNAVSMDIDVGTALSAAETVNGLYIDIDGNAGDNGGSYMNAISITSADTTGGVNTGINIDGTWDAGLDLSGATLTKDVILQNGEQISNGTNGYVNTDGAFVISGTGGSGTASAVTFAYASTAAGAQTATMTNAPASGNPTVWLSVWYGATKYVVPLFASS